MRRPIRLVLTTLVLAALNAAHATVSQNFAVAATPTEVRPEVDKAYAQLQAAPAIQKLLDAVKADHERSIDDLKALTEIEAPPFKEHRRAEAFLARMKALGLPDARIDAEGNVIGLRKGSGNGPRLLVSAHLDTVFPAGTDVKVKELEGRLFAPGIADDTRGLTVLLSWLKVLNDQKIQTVGDLLFVANVGEEELGNLRGMKAIFRDHPEIDGMVGLEPAPQGSVLILATASHRYEVTFQGPGGHSFGAFGQVPSAIHGMGRAIAKIGDVRAPSFPKTTFTVGTVSGGTSVNTIAPDAKMTIDIRSDDPASLLETEKKILAAIDEAVIEENRRWNVSSLSATRRLIGDRPGGRTAPDSVIVEAATRANAAFGHRTLLRGGSTDANIPISLGVPAIIVGGGGRATGFHSLAESIDVTDGWKGAQNSLATVLGLVGVQGISPALLPRRAAKAK